MVYFLYMTFKVDQTQIMNQIFKKFLLFLPAIFSGISLPYGLKGEFSIFSAVAFILVATIISAGKQLFQIPRVKTQNLPTEKLDFF